MTRIKKWKLILAAMLAALFAVTFGLALHFSTRSAVEADEVTIQIHNKGDGNIYYTASPTSRAEWRYRSGFGTVTYNDQTISSQEATEKTITAQVSEAGLTVKAEAQDGSLFYCWATDEKAENVVSMKAEDTFTYEEVQTFEQAGLYAFFVPELSEDTRANMQFKITYNERLGDVYLFLKKENVDNETAQKHGFLIPSGQLIDIPFVQREVWNTRGEEPTLSSTAREVNNITFAAIPKSEINSTIDLSRSTSAVFKNWAATYSATNESGKQALDEAYRPLPDICDTSQNTSSTNPEDGSIDYIPNQRTPVDETWVIPSLSTGRSSIEPEPVYSSSNSNWLINPFDNKYTYGNTISVQQQTIVAEFQEVAIVPDIEVTPIVGDELQDPITFDSESTEHITFYYGQRNSINAIFATPEQLVKQPDYQVTQTSLDVATGKYTSKTIPVTEVVGTVRGFNISDIVNNCTITVTPNYGEEYFINSFVITVDVVTQNGFNDLVSKESEAVTVVSEDDWYFNPQLTSNGVYTFTSGISYLTDLSKKSDSQLHFQVKGSGVFTFEFYLDGAGMAPYMPAAYAVYGIGAPIDKSGISNGNFGNNATALAQGNTQVGSLTDITYRSCNILAPDKVTRIDTVTDWCRASIAVTAEGDDTSTDIYVAFVSYPYNSQMGAIFAPHSVMSVRNVAYYQGHSNVSWGIYDNDKGDKTTWGTISAKSGGEDAAQTDLSSGTMIDFSIDYDDAAYKFYGWSDGAELLSTEKEFSYIVKGKTDGTSVTKINAVLAPIDNPYTYRAGGEFYDENSLEAALGKAAELRTSVYVLQSVEIKKSVTIAQNVNLVIPFDETGRLHGSAAEGDEVQKEISWLVEGDNFKYITVTVADSVIVTVEGGLYLGGVVNHPSQTYQGHTSGAYSEIVNNGAIVVGNGGIMDIYGHVTGTGTITVNYGGKLYEPFLILDYAGGTNTLGIFAAGQTPFKRYAMINIECPMTIHYGGMLYGHATLYALSAFFSLDQPFVSYDMGADQGGDGFGHDTIIMLSDGASVTITYNSQKVVHSSIATNCTEGIGQTKLEFTGGAVFSYMLFSAMGLEIPTNSVYFAIPYNFEVELNDFATPQNNKHAEYETKTDFMIMPGAKVTVGVGVTLTINANAWVLDGLKQGALDGKSYPTADELKTAGYSKSGNFIVNGKLIIGEKTTVEGFDIGSILGGGSDGSFESEKIPATFLGVVQTNGTGSITIPAKTKLSGTIVDGIENRTYFAYTTTARVWVADDTKEGGGFFADLEAGKTYTATGSNSFTLAEVKYKTTESGAEDNTLTLGSAMTGAWKVDHTQHKYDWTLTDGEKNLNGAKFKKLTRRCTEVGCTETEHRLLLADEAFSLSADYKGSAFSMEDLLKLFYKHYFDSETVPAEYAQYFHAEVTGDTKNQNAAIYNNYTVTLTGGFFGENAENTSKTFSFTVKQFDVSTLDPSKIKAALKAKNFTYDGNAKSLDNDTLERLLQEAFGSDVSHEAFVWNNNTNAGENTASVTITGTGENFEGTLTVNFSIAKAKLTVALEETTQTYGTNPVTPNIKVEGAKNSEESAIKTALTRTAKATQWSDVGDYGVNWTYNENEGVLKNYAIKFANKEATLYKVTAKDITHEATVTATGVTYNGEEQEAELNFTFDGYTDHFTKGTDYTVSYAKGGETSPKNAGTYTVTITGTKNYSGSITCNYVISPKAITVTVNAQTFTYNREAHDYNDKQEGTWTVADLATDDDKSVLNVTITGSATDAGKYAVTCGYENGNYTVTFAGKDEALVIEAAEITEVTVTGSYTYNGTAQTPNLTVKAGSLTLNDGEYTVSYDKSEVKDADTYTVTVTAKGGNFKDKAEKVSTTFTIAKAKVTVKADDQSTPEGENILSGNALTWKVTAGQFFNNDQELEGSHFKVTTTAVSTEADKDFPITIDWADGYTCKNYDVTFNEGTYHIVAAIFKDVTITKQTVNYNGENQNIVVTINNEQIAGAATISITKDGQPFTGATNAGTYQLKVDITADGYTTKYHMDVTFTINKISVTVTFNSASSIYGDAVKSAAELTYTMPAGVLEKDHETFKAAIHPTTTATSESTVDGKYTITAEKPVLDNYDVTIVDGVYTIEKAALTVTIQSSSHVYGAAAKGALSVTLEGVKNDDESAIKSAITLSTEAEQWSAKGNYAITANYNAETGILANYTVSITNATNTLYAVTAKSIEGATMSATGTTYSGQMQEANLAITFDGYLEHFKKGTDYTVSYDKDEVKNAGTYTVTLTAKGNYEGKITCQFVIDKATITSVTVTGDALTYDGTNQASKVTLEVKAGSLTLGAGDYTVTFAKGEETEVKNAGTYTVTIAPIANGNYKLGNVSTATFEVNKKSITVKADDLESIYGEKVEALTYTAEGLVEGEKAEEVLTVTLTPNRTIKEADTYTITGTGTADNYTFTVTSGTYTVKEREITVKINDQSILYNGIDPTVPQAQDVGWTITKGNVIDGDNLMIKLTKAPGVNAGDYEISGTFNNKNYKVTFEGTMGTAGKFTIQKRAVTVVIEAQSATYDPAHNYAFVGTKWHVKEGEGDGLAPNETKEVLAVTLTKADMTDVGTYDINGAWSNNNYAVTFEGGEDAYTVNKKDISTEGDFFIVAGGESSVGDLLSVKFAGQPIDITGYVLLGDAALEVTLALSPDQITEVGNFTLTVTVEDTNYSGSKTFRVVVKNADGYTKRLVETIAQLGELAEGMTAEAFTAEDFAALKQMKTLIDALDEDEKTTGAAALAPYEALISAWNEAVEGLDEKIETAQSIGDALLGGLIGVTATLSALAAVAYVFGKGGIL